MDRGEIARKAFLEGYNCAQAVVLAFLDEMDADRETMLRAALPLGGGLGRMREVCGTVSGACVCLGLLFPKAGKSELYALEQEFARRFRERNGSIRCADLLTGAGIVPDTSPNAEKRTAEYYKKRPCPALAADAASILEGLVRETKERDK